MIRIAYGQTDPWDREREWLDTDGRGGYASATPSGCHTRRYHGLLAPNLAIPEGRHLLLAKFEDSLTCDGQETFFTAHTYPGCLFPPGDPPLREFRLDLHPSFVYAAGALTLKKSLLLLPSRDALLIRYEIAGPDGECILRFKPFLAFRGYHALMEKNPYLDGRTEPLAEGFRISPYAGMPPLVVLTSPGPRFSPAGLWYERFEYAEERRRGFAWQEDLFLPGLLEIPCRPGQDVWVAAACTLPEEPLCALWDREIARRREERRSDERLAAGLLAAGLADRPPASGFMATSADPPGRDAASSLTPEATTGLSESGGPASADAVPPPSDWTAEDQGLLTTLLAAGRQFLITTPSGRPAVIAGYPWFCSWGRDTLLALPGLAFCCGRIDTGVAILAEIGRHEREGILPNFFSADGAPAAYNTVDSSLLYFWTVQQFLRTTGDLDLVRKRFWPVMKRILRRFRDGTRFAVAMDERGLLSAGDSRTALTWMDATVGGIPVTPRHGLAVEINALWYNALCLADALAARFGDDALPTSGLSSRIARAFQETFWNEAANCLGDVARDGVLDRAIRPNQIFAVSLPHSPLTTGQQAAVVAAVRDHLLTPCGLRTLAPGHPDYRGRYQGGPAERDGAYHQGTVWPWLLGPYGEAALRVAADRPQAKRVLRGFLRRFLTRHLGEAGIGSVSEVFDGEAPHRPGGCIAQAWSVGELIRLYTLLENGDSSRFP